MLLVKEIDSFYGDLQVLRNVSLEVEEGKITSIIGSNGAGKTTLLNSIVGLVKVKSGGVFFKEQRIDHLRPHQIAAMGISVVPEGRRLFTGMSVQDNLQLGAYGKSARQRVQQNLPWIFNMFPTLRARLQQPSGTLSGGEQQMLAIGRALMSEPRILILDEPSLGLMPLLIARIFEVIQEIRKKGVTVLIVEQNVGETLANADRYYILETGRITNSGLCMDFEKHEELRKAYLGW
ncbi:MAG: ABC transporter ATP-binding protein [Desulfobacteraceae bacterium]|jgi:branched-chain amino acid transport system ATP-binding protein|nr:MAG: ABC transporter ATP-binding protein [Desulfobacteraceae bacterium]